MPREGQKFSERPEHTGPLTDTIIPMVDAEGLDRKYKAEKLVTVDGAGKVDAALLPFIPDALLSNKVVLLNGLNKIDTAFLPDDFGGASNVVSPEKYGAVGNGIADDSAAIQAMINAVAPTGGAIWCKNGATYKINTVIQIANIGYNKQLIIYGNNCKFKGDNIFNKAVADQTVAGTAVSSAFRVYNADFFSTGYDSGTQVGTGIHIRASAHTEIIGCHFFGYVNAFIIRFGLFSYVARNRYTSCTHGEFFGFGDWTGATNANSQSNVVRSIQNRYFGPASNTLGRGFTFNACSDSRIEQSTIEGFGCQYGIFFDSDASTVVMDFHIIGCHVEATNIYGSVIYWHGAGVLNIDTIYQQIPGRMLDVHSVGYPVIKIARLPYALNISTIKNDTASNRFFFEGMQSGWTWQNIFEITGGSVQPTNVTHMAEGYIYGNHLSLNAQTTINLNANSSIPAFSNGSYYQNAVFGIYGAFEAFRLSGTTAQRPTLGTIHAGLPYYDTTINKKIVWTGTAWQIPSTVSLTNDYNDLINKPVVPNTYLFTLESNTADHNKLFTAGSFLHRLILRSTTAIAVFKVGTTAGGAEIWTGALAADDTDHTKDEMLNLKMWIPKDKTIYFTGTTGSGGTVHTWYNYNTTISIP
jgi:hypothetical protein